MKQSEITIDDLLASADSHELDRLMNAAAAECHYHEQLDVQWSYWHYGRHAEHARELGMHDLSALFSAAWSIGLEVIGDDSDGCVRQQAAERIKDRYLLACRGALGELSPEERKAVFEFRAEHGRRWKEDLRSGWLRAAFPGPLQRIRNAHGPEWLQRVKEAEFSPFEQLVRCEEDTLATLRSLGVDCGEYDPANKQVKVSATLVGFDRIAEFPADFQIAPQPRSVVAIAPRRAASAPESEAVVSNP